MGPILKQNYHIKLPDYLILALNNHQIIMSGYIPQCEFSCGKKATKQISVEGETKNFCDDCVQMIFDQYRILKTYELPRASVEISKAGEYGSAGEADEEANDPTPLPKIISKTFQSYQNEEKSVSMTKITVTMDNPPQNQNTVFVVDVSGSMGWNGSPIDQIKEILLENADLPNLTIVLFHNTASVEILTQKSHAYRRDFINGIRAGGGTSFVQALMVCNDLITNSSKPLSFVFLTDGNNQHDNDYHFKQIMEQVNGLHRAHNFVFHTCGLGKGEREGCAKIRPLSENGGSHTILTNAKDFEAVSCQIKNTVLQIMVNGKEIPLKASDDEKVFNAYVFGDFEPGDGFEQSDQEITIENTVESVCASIESFKMHVLSELASEKNQKAAIDTLLNFDRYLSSLNLMSARHAKKLRKDRGRAARASILAKHMDKKLRYSEMIATAQKDIMEFIRRIKQHQSLDDVDLSELQAAAQNVVQNYKRRIEKKREVLSVKNNVSLEWQNGKIDERKKDIDIDPDWKDKSCHLCLSTAQDICDEGEMMGVPVNITSVLGSGILSVYQTTFDTRLSTWICSTCATDIFRSGIGNNFKGSVINEQTFNAFVPMAFSADHYDQVVRYLAPRFISWLHTLAFDQWTPEQVRETPFLLMKNLISQKRTELVGWYIAETWKLCQYSARRFNIDSRVLRGDLINPLNRGDDDKTSAPVMDIGTFTLKCLVTDNQCEQEFLMAGFLEMLRREVGKKAPENEQFPGCNIFDEQKLKSSYEKIIKDKVNGGMARSDVLDHKEQYVDNLSPEFVKHSKFIQDNIPLLLEKYNLFLTTVGVDPLVLPDSLDLYLVVHYAYHATNSTFLSSLTSKTLIDPMAGDRTHLQKLFETQYQTMYSNDFNALVILKNNMGKESKALWQFANGADGYTIWQTAWGRRFDTPTNEIVKNVYRKIRHNHQVAKEYIDAAISPPQYYTYSKYVNL